MNWLVRLFFCGLFLLCWGGLGAGLQPVYGQNKVTEDKKAKETRLKEIKDSLQQAQDRQEALKQEIEALNNDVGAINRALIETAKRCQVLEGEVSQAEERLQKAQEKQAALRQSLSSKRALLAEVLAAVQRMGHHPPPALLVRPDDVLDSIRSALVLGAALPDIRAQSDVLFKQLQALQETTRKVKKHQAALAQSFNQLAEDEIRLTKLVEEKNRLVARSRKSLDEEKNLSAALAAKAESFEALIATLESKISSSAAAARAAKEADQRRLARENERLLSARKQLKSHKGLRESEEKIPLVVGDPTRLEPAVAFSKAKGSLYWPVRGRQLYGFATSLAGQEKSSHIALETRPNARVRAPADGWVVYAGPFRSFGKLIILNVGENYHIVMAGLFEVNVQPGRFVLAGEPIGRMGRHRIAAIVPVNKGSKKPVLTVEFRKNGKPTDPTPWWGPRVAKIHKPDVTVKWQESDENET